MGGSKNFLVDPKAQRTKLVMVTPPFVAVFFKAYSFHHRSVNSWSREWNFRRTVGTDAMDTESGGVQLNSTTWTVAIASRSFEKTAVTVCLRTYIHATIYSLHPIIQDVVAFKIYFTKQDVTATPSLSWRPISPSMPSHLSCSSRRQEMKKK
jgi:hypothetical protein